MTAPRLCPSCHVNPVIPSARAEVDGRAYRYQRCQHCTNKGAERQARLAAQSRAERQAMLDQQPAGRELAERLAQSRRALEWTEPAMLCDIAMQRTPSHEELR